MVRRAQRFSLALALFFFLGAARAEDSADFVMLIDLSPRMAARQLATAQTVRNLAITGIHGRMREGDKLTIWYYDTKFSTNIAPLVWDSAHAKDFAASAGRSFRAKQFLKTPRPKGPTLGPVVGKTAWFTAMVLTDGYLPFAGTPFDSEINSSLAYYRNSFTRAKKPFLVTLLARNGDWVAFNVHTNLGAAIELPEVPKNTEVIEKALVALRSAITNPPAAVVVEKPKVEEPKPVIAPPPKIEPPPIQVVQKPVEELPKPAEKIPEKAQPPVVQETNLPPPAPIEPEVPKPIPSTPVAVVLPAPPPASFPWPLLLAGFGVIASISALIYMRVAQAPAKPRGSLISRSLDAERELKGPRRP